MGFEKVLGTDGSMVDRPGKVGSFILSRQPSQVAYHLVTVSQGRCNVAKSSHPLKTYSLLTKTNELLRLRQYTDIQQTV
eukprot:3946342-Pleurochrysis_carterae.AAC.1